MIFIWFEIVCWMWQTCVINVVFRTHHIGVNCYSVFNWTSRNELKKRTISMCDIFNQDIRLTCHNVSSLKFGNSLSQFLAFVRRSIENKISSSCFELQWSMFVWTISPSLFNVHLMEENVQKFIFNFKSFKTSSLLHFEFVWSTFPDRCFSSNHKL